MLVRELILPHNTTECHASTIIEMPSGDFLAAWFEGIREAARDTAIWIARRSPRGWEEPRVAIKMIYEAHWNPVLYLLPDKRIALYFKVGCSVACWKTYVMYSYDEGEHWSIPVELVAGDLSGGCGPVKNQPLLLRNGILIAPASTEQGNWMPFVDISFSSGEEWEKRVPVPLPTSVVQTQKNSRPVTLGLIQPALWESEPGEVHMLLRSNNGRIFRSDSHDSGLSWSVAYATELPNNNSGIDLKKMPDGRLILICNISDQNWGPRKQIALRYSDDNGTSWSEPFVLEAAREEMFSARHKSEFSYPTVIVTSEGKIAMTYTWHRENIRFVIGSFLDFTGSQHQ